MATFDVFLSPVLPGLLALVVSCLTIDMSTRSVILRLGLTVAWEVARWLLDLWTIEVWRWVIAVSIRLGPPMGHVSSVWRFAWTSHAVLWFMQYSRYRRLGWTCPFRKGFRYTTLTQNKALHRLNKNFAIAFRFQCCLKGLIWVQIYDLCYKTKCWTTIPSTAVTSSSVSLPRRSCPDVTISPNRSWHDPTQNPG